MKVLYFSQPFFADCDLPLVKELQSKGVDVRLYMPLRPHFQRSSILEFNEPINRWGIIKATHVKDMEVYKDCVDLNRLYFICGKSLGPIPFTWLAWIFVYIHMLFQGAQVLHITWQLSHYEKILFYLPFVTRIMTVHDPIQHSNTDDEEKKESERIACFKWADKFVLLNQLQVKEFAETYHIQENKIYVTKLGVYDSIFYMKSTDAPSFYVNKPYLLYFGLISSYKGVEYLMEAMVKVHHLYPDVNLVVAGGGKYYFDVSQYKKLDYIRIENRFIGIKELIPLVRNSLFTICPYKDATQSGVVQTSFALGIPVVATNVGALPKMVIDDVYGKIVPPCDSESLSVAMVDLINHSNKLEKMKKNIKEQWLPSMSWTPIANDYIRIYGS